MLNTPLYDYVEGYVKSRLGEQRLVGYVAGSITLLTTAYAMSPGRRLSKQFPPPKMVRVMCAPLPKRAAGIVLPRYSSREKFNFLLRIAVPSLYSKETGLICGIAVMMLIRTYLFVGMARMTGKLGQVVLEGNFRTLALHVGGFLMSSVPVAIIKQVMFYFRQMLEVNFRTNLTRYFHRRYLKEKVFFRVAGLRDIDRVDQRITEDIIRWSRATSRLFLTIPNPLVMTTVFSFILAKHTGWRGPLLSFAFYLGFVGIVALRAPNIDWLVNQRMEREGEFRAAHQTLLSCAEDIFITNGVPHEANMLSKLFTRVTDHGRYTAYVHARFNILEVLYTKYGSVLMGYAVCAMALFKSGKPLGTVADIIGQLAETGYVFEVLAKSIGHLLWNARLLLVVNGYTQRVFQFVEGLDIADMEAARQNELTIHTPRQQPTPDGTANGYHQNGFKPTHGRVVRGQDIEFVDVPLTIPNGEVLCASLSFYVKAGMNLLIMGPNGCGKSSTFRLLGELWPLHAGKIVKPERDQIYYVPQRPYMYDGTLFEQVIYPLRRRQVSVGEAQLFECLAMAGLGDIFSKSHISWNAHLSWSDDSLSAGEKQRLAMARLFFHRPRFAVLDECSSSVDHDVEQAMYATCRELGISVITIAHRRSVWQYHNWILRFDGNGGYLFSPLRFENDGKSLVLTRVVSSSDKKQIGKELVFNISDDFEDRESQ